MPDSFLNEVTTLLSFTCIPFECSYISPFHSQHFNALYFTTVRYQQKPRLERQIHDINELLLCVIVSNFRSRIS